MLTTSSEPHDKIKAHVSVIFALVNVCMYVLSCLFNLQDKQIALLIIELLKISECNVIEKWADYTQSLFASQDGTYFLVQVQILQSFETIIILSCKTCHNG